MGSRDEVIRSLDDADREASSVDDLVSRRIGGSETGTLGDACSREDQNREEPMEAAVLRPLHVIP